MNYFTPFMDVPRRRRYGLEALIERNVLRSNVASIVVSAPIFFALGFAVAARLIGRT
jgi:hypothetical protein